MIRRIIAGIGLLLALPGLGLGSEAPAPEPPVYRYLIVVEASDSMERQKEVAMDTVHALLLSGFNGRIQKGEVLGIWTYKDQLDYRLVRPIHWSAREARDLSNFIYRKLRDLDFSDEPNIRIPLAAIAAEAGRSELLTVFLVTSGSELIRGTPFDAEINAVFEQHGAAMAKAKRPFVTVLVFEGGELVAQAVTPGGRSIYIPPTPASTAALAAAAIPEAAKPEPELPTPAPAPKPKPMSVEEISARLREAQARQRALETNQVPAATTAVAGPGADEPAPRIELPVSGNPQTQVVEVTARDEPVVPEEKPAAEPERPAEIPAAPVESAESRQPPVQTELERRTSEASVKPADQATVEVAPPTPSVQQAEPSTAVVTGPDAAAVQGGSAAGGTEEPVAPGLMLPPGEGGQQSLYLSAGVGLFVVAMGILWWRMRRPRGRVRASVISQSMHRR